MVEVSIVICTRNRANQLQAALDALAGIRTEHVWEAVILDNGSTDHTEAVIASYASKDPRFHPAREEQPGLGAARDTAWRKASGKIVSFTDDDCYVAEDYVDRIVEAFGERPQAGYLGGRILLHDPSDAPVTIMTNTDPFDMPSRSFIAPGVLHGANLSFRREALEAIGGVSRDMGAGTPFPCEDVDAVANAVLARSGEERSLEEALPVALKLQGLGLPGQLPHPEATRGHSRKPGVVVVLNAVFRSNFRQPAGVAPRRRAHAR